MFNKLCMLSVILLALSCVSSLFGQSTEAEIKARLKGRPLYLRGFWDDDELKFDATGKLTSTSGVVSFTLSGFEFKYAHLKRDKLILEGPRIVTKFAQDVPERVGLNSDIHLEIAQPANGDFGPALDRIFADGLPALAPSLPSYWQAFARCHLTEPTSAADCSLYPSKSQMQVSKPQMPESCEDFPLPRGTKFVPAKFSDYARGVPYSAHNVHSVVRFVITREGLPSALMIFQPYGLGQDERALESVAQWRYAPAMKDGKPVECEIRADVEMEVF